MLLNFRCRRCRRPLSVEADQKGTTVHCPKCQCEMVVPDASEPNVPRGQILVGIYAIEKDDSKGESAPDPVQHSIREMTIRDLLPGEKKPSDKSKDKPRGPHTPQPPRRNHRLWSRPALVTAGVFVVAVAALGAYVARQISTVSPEKVEDASLASADPAPIPVSLPVMAAPPAEVAKLPATHGPVASAAAAPARGEPVAVRTGSLAQAPAEKKPAAVPLPAPKPEDMKARADGSSRVAIKRRDTQSEEELRKDLRRTPEIPSLNAEQVSRLLLTHGQHFQVSGDLDFEPRALLETRPDLKSLPVRHGRAGQVDPWTAANLEAFARKLHVLIDRVVPREKDGSHIQPVLLHEFMRQEVRGKRPPWLRPEAIPALQQILMHEDKAIRWLLVELLAEIPGPAASAALARRAMYDLSPELRDLAIEALKSRPAQEYRQELLSGFRYPWPPVADHAAEALAALDDKGAISNLVTLLKMPDPTLPFETTRHQTFVRELVRINHQSNCLMCHAPAQTKGDPVVAAVPGFFTSAVSFASNSYGPTRPKVYSSPLWLRADVTYLRQDFSVHDLVASASGNPGTDQRFDYLVRTRICKRADREGPQAKPSGSSYPQREAVLWALRELSGKDAGSKTEEWVKLFPRAELDTEAAQLSTKLVKAKGAKQTQLLAKFKDQEGVTYTQALAGAVPQLHGKVQLQARQVLAERLSRMTVETLRGRLKDDDTEIRRAAAAACALKAKDDLVPDLLDLLEDPEPAVVEAAQTALQRLTGREVGAGG